MSISERIRSTRQTLGLTMDELAQRCGWKGAKQRISNYESGDRTPRIPDLHKLAAALDRPVEWLTFGDKGYTGVVSDERELLALWREAPPESQQAILALLRSQAHQARDNSRAPSDSSDDTERQKVIKLVS